MMQPSQASGHLQPPEKEEAREKQRSALKTKQTMLEQQKKKSDSQDDFFFFFEIELLHFKLFQEAASKSSKFCWSYLALDKLPGPCRGNLSCSFHCWMYH